jgi:excisionase family DNA binding protein
MLLNTVTTVATFNELRGNQMEEVAKRQPYKTIGLATRWNVSRGHVHNLIEAGKLKAVMIGGCRRIPYDVVKEYEQSIGLDIDD